MGKKTIYSREYKLLVERLRGERERRGITQTSLAAALGWSQQQLSAVEAGARRLDVLEFLQVSSALGLTRDQAIHLIPKMK